MNVHLLWVIAVSLFMFACGEQQAPQETDEPQVEAPATEPVELEAPPKPEDAVSQEFIDHMHAHAEQMDEMMFALADGNLDNATTAAYWLSRHKSVSGVPDDWQQYIEGMREDARAVENAPDLETARAAAERISVHCQGCHSAAGVLTE